MGSSDSRPRHSIGGWPTPSLEKRALESAPTGSGGSGSVSGGYQDWTDVLLDVLSDDYSRRIFASAIPRGKTIEELCLELRIPLSSCYRKVALMVERGVMIIERRTVARRGGRYAAYRSVFERVSVELKDGKVSVEVSLNRETLQNPNYRRAATTWEAGRAEAIVDLLNR